MSGTAVSGARAPSYVVKRGDTLWSIARRFNTQVSVLRSLNGKDSTSSLIRVGEAIALPVPAILPEDTTTRAAARLRTPAATRPLTSPPGGNPRSLLQQISAPGASARTAGVERVRSTGVAASEVIARKDLRRIRRFEAAFIAAAQQTGLPPALLAGIASRETHGGSFLKADGWSSRGDYGMMQVNRIHTPVQSGGPTGYGHVLQAAGILKEQLRLVRRKHPSWSHSQQLRGAVAAYNFGVKNVRTLAGLDVGTPNADYSADAVARAQYFERVVPGFARAAVSALPT